MNNVKFNKNFTIAYVSKEFKEKMYQFGSDEHKVLQELRQIYPNIKVRVASNHVSDVKKLTYQNMLSYLETKRDMTMGEEKKRYEKLLIDFNSIKKLSKIQHNPYRCVLEWFKNVCPELFQKEEAKEDNMIDMFAVTASTDEEAAS